MVFGVAPLAAASSLIFTSHLLDLPSYWKVEAGLLRAAVDAIRLARRTLRTIKGNLFWAFAYNVAALPLAALGLPGDDLAPQAGDQRDADGDQQDAAELLDAADVPAHPAGGAYRPAGAQRQQDEGQAEAEAVGGDQQQAAAGGRADVGAAGQRDHAGEGGPEARRPAQAVDGAEQRRAPQAGPRRVAELHAALEHRNHAEEHQPHGDGNHAADALQQVLVGQQGIREPEHGDGAGGEDHGEAGHEQQGGAGDPPAAGGRFLAGGDRWRLGRRAPTRCGGRPPVPTVTRSTSSSPSPSAPPSPLPAPAAARAISWLDAVVRWILFAGLAIGLG